LKYKNFRFYDKTKIYLVNSRTQKRYSVCIKDFIILSYHFISAIQRRNTIVRSIDIGAFTAKTIIFLWHDFVIVAIYHSTRVLF